MDYCKSNPIPKWVECETNRGSASIANRNKEANKLREEMVRCLWPSRKNLTLSDIEKHNHNMLRRENKSWIHTHKKFRESALDNAPFDAFNCFVSDALSGSETFEDFCDNFGYDNDSRKAEKIYFACQDQLKKLRQVYYHDIYDLANSLER